MRLLMSCLTNPLIMTYIKTNKCSKILNLKKEQLAETKQSKRRILEKVIDRCWFNILADTFADKAGDTSNIAYIVK